MLTRMLRGDIVEKKNGAWWETTEPLTKEKLWKNQKKWKSVLKLFTILWKQITLRKLLDMPLNKFLGNYLQNRRVPTDIEMTLKLKKTIRIKW